MDGTGSTNALPNGYPPDPYTVWMSQGQTSLRPLAEPTSNGNVFGVSPAGFFVWHRSLDYSVQTALVNCGTGAAKSSDWLPSADPTSLYQKAVSRLDAVLAENPTGHLAGFLLSDGYNNAIHDTLSTWLSDWTTIMAALRTRYGNKPLVYCRLPDAAPGPGELGYPMPGHDNVIADQVAFQSANNTMVVTPSADFLAGQTGVHKTTAGALALAALLEDAAPESSG